MGSNTMNRMMISPKISDFSPGAFSTRNKPACKACGTGPSSPNFVIAAALASGRASFKKISIGSTMIMKIAPNTAPRRLSMPPMMMIITKSIDTWMLNISGLRNDSLWA